MFLHAMVAWPHRQHFEHLGTSAGRKNSLGRIYQVKKRTLPPRIRLPTPEDRLSATSTTTVDWEAPSLHGRKRGARTISVFCHSTVSIKHWVSCSSVISSPF